MRSIHEILSEAWAEVKNNNGVVLNTVDFELLQIVRGDHKIVSITFTAEPLARKQKEQP